MDSVVVPYLGRDVAVTARGVAIATKVTVRAVASRGPTLPGASEATEACNIGPAELRRRRRSAVVAALALAAALLAIVAGVLPPWTAPYLAPLVGAVVATGLQVWLRFCVAFGLAGLVGMGDDPGAVTVDPALRAAHRRRAGLMLAAAALSMLAWVVLTGALVLATG